MSKTLKISLFLMISTVVFAQKSAEQYFEDGVILLNSQKYQKAIRNFDKAISINQRVASFWEKRGTAYFGLYNYVQAINDYSVAINLSPFIGFYYVERALAFFALGHQQSMINDMIVAAKLGDQDAIKIISNLITANNEQNQDALQKDIQKTNAAIEQRFGMKPGTLSHYSK